MVEIMLDPRGARVSPLDGMRIALSASAQPGRVTIAEMQFLTQIGLRGDPADPAFATAVKAATALDLPAACQATSAGDFSLLWLGPDEWLLLGPDGAAPTLVDALEKALDGIHSQVVDLSANRTTICLDGSRAREVLEKGMGLDLRPAAFGPGSVAQTMMARAPVILEAREREGAYRLLVRNSFAVYLATWLLDAASEYRIAPA